MLGRILDKILDNEIYMKNILFLVIFAFISILFILELAFIKGVIALFIENYNDSGIEGLFWCSMAIIIELGIWLAIFFLFLKPNWKK